MSQRMIWMDVSIVMNGKWLRPQGVPRFILEVSGELSEHSNVRFFRYEPQLGILTDVSRTELRQRRLSLLYAATTSEPSRSAQTKSFDRIPNISRRNRNGLAQVRQSLRAAWTSQRNALRNLASAGKKAFWYTIRAGRPSAKCLSDTWSHNDVVCLFGLWAVNSADDHHFNVSSKAKESGSVIVRFLHDIIPVIRPQFTGRNPSYHAPSLHQALAESDVLMANSEGTKSDVELHAREHGISIPSISVIRMASSVHAADPVRPESLVDIDDFVLCVGTIEIRKNHHLLLDIWERFVADLPSSEIPNLVIAGSPGWINTETMSRIRFTPTFAGTVLFVESPSDSEVAWLYQNCRFTVYPSRYEGWGYPITESLNAGKVCVASKVSSMPEAAGGLCPLIDPLDRPTWSRTILHLFHDHHARRDLELNIERKHVVTTAADTAYDVWNALEAISTAGQPIVSSS